MRMDGRACGARGKEWGAGASPVAQSCALSCLSQISAFCALPRAALVFAHACGSLWASGPSAHRAHASLRHAHGFAAPLRVALGLRPKCPQGTRFPARLPGFGAVPGRSIVAEGAGRAHRSFRSLANIGVLCAGRAQPLYLLTPSGRFGPLAQVPTGHTLPFGAPPGRFGPLAQQPTGLTLPSGAPKTCAAAQNASVASAQRAQETRHTPPSQKSHERPSASIKKNRPPPHKRERAATRPAGSIRQTDSPSDTAATRAGCRRCP